MSASLPTPTHLGFAVADRVLIMSRGSFSLSGRPDEIKAHRDFDGAYFGVAMSGASFF